MMEDEGHRRSHLIAWAVLAAVMTTMIAVGIWPGDAMRRGRRAAVTEARVLPAVLFAAPEFELTDQTGRRFSSRELRGQVWIADFIFTSCAGPCPQMSRSLAALGMRLSDLGLLKLVSFTVDPDRDTPEVLARYGEWYGADPRRWVFLTGESETLERLATEGFRVVARRTTTQERSAGMDDILHSTYFVLVDGAGQVRGLYDGTDAERLEQLVLDVRALVGKRGR